MQSILSKLGILILVLISAKGNCQVNYIEYYNLINEGNKAYFEKNYKKSLANYQEGFEKVEYVHSINYAKAARSANKTKNYKLTSNYLYEAIKRGYPSKIIERKEFKTFRKKNEYKTLKFLLKEKDSNQIKEQYKRKIDSLHFIDQNILRGNKTVKGFELNLNLKYSDSLNFKCLLNLIEKNNFPSEKNLGFDGYRKSKVIIHHNARLIKNAYYHQILREYVYSGEFIPEHYCWIIDQYQELKKEPLIYYHWDVAKNIKDLSENDKKRIDKRRNEIGMPSINRIEISTRKGKQNVKLKW